VESRFDDAIDGPEAGLIQTLSSLEAFSVHELYLFVKIKIATDLTECGDGLEIKIHLMGEERDKYPITSRTCIHKPPWRNGHTRP
jgi:hypothetical protein